MIKFRNENYGVETILKGGNSDLEKALIFGEGDVADFTGITNIANHIGYYNRNVKNVILDKETESIPQNFFESSLIESIDLSDCVNLKTTGYNSLMSCGKLTTIDMSGCVNLTTIGIDFLLGCYNLTTLDLSDCVNLNTISSGFLTMCYNLQYVKLGALTPPTLSSYLSFSTSASIYVPDESVDTYKTAPYWSNRATQIKPISEAPQI